MKNNTNLPIPGRKGAIARLIVLAIFALIAFLGSFGTIGEFIPKQGFWNALVEAIGGCGVLLLTGAWFWGLMKWIGFIAPKSFGAAGALWNGWIPLTFLGLYIKACLWLIIAMAPISAYALSFSLLYKVFFNTARAGITIFSAAGYLLLGIASTALLLLVDVCKLKGLSAKAVLREKLFSKGGVKRHA